MDQWWSWVLTIVGLSGFILAGKKVWWCWYINIFAQILWFTYAIVTDQYGFIVASLAYTFVFTKNAIAWTKEHRDEKLQREAQFEVLRSYAQKDVDLTMELFKARWEKRDEEKA